MESLSVNIVRADTVARVGKLLDYRLKIEGLLDENYTIRVDKSPSLHFRFGQVALRTLLKEQANGTIPNAF